jgi:hypothetical protein
MVLSGLGQDAGAAASASPSPSSDPQGFLLAQLPGVLNQGNAANQSFMQQGMMLMNFNNADSAGRMKVGMVVAGVAAIIAVGAVLLLRK